MLKKQYEYFLNQVPKLGLLKESDEEEDEWYEEVEDENFEEEYRRNQAHLEDLINEYKRNTYNSLAHIIAKSSIDFFGTALKLELAVDIHELYPTAEIDYSENVKAEFSLECIYTLYLNVDTGGIDKIMGVESERPGYSIILYQNTLTHTVSTEEHLDQFAPDREWIESVVDMQQEENYENLSGLDRFTNNVILTDDLMPNNVIIWLGDMLADGDITSDVILFLFIKSLTNVQISPRPNGVNLRQLRPKLNTTWDSIRGNCPSLGDDRALNPNTMRQCGEKMRQSEDIAGLLHFSPFYLKLHVPPSDHDALEDLMEF